MLSKRKEYLGVLEGHKSKVIKSLRSEVKKVLRAIINFARGCYIKHLLRRRLSRSRVNQRVDYEKFKLSISIFVNSLKIQDQPFHYKFSASNKEPTLYASVYACMTLSLLGELTKLSTTEKEGWRNYFDSFQNDIDGLFYDSVVNNAIYKDSDWWGARHLAVHIIAAYTTLGFKPKFSFRFLQTYYKENAIAEWLDSIDWNSSEIGEGDIDNKIMNIGCLLQYQRDVWNDESAGIAINQLKDYLKAKINKETGMWGGFDINDPNQRSRMVQFAYHIFPIFFYDGDYAFDCEKIVSHVLKTQNRFNGFGVDLNSSACEDMDSIFLVIKLQEFCSSRTRSQVKASIEKALKWVLLNHVEDGGFVFRLEENFFYGSNATSSKKNSGAMLSTWFRLLSVAYMTNYLNNRTPFKITNCPGYEFL